MTKYLADYTPYPFDLKTTNLRFEIGEESTVVQSKLSLHKKSDSETSSISLDGKNLEFISVKLDGRELSGNEFSVSDEELTIFDVPDQFELEIKNRIFPAENQTKVGLYTSNDVLVTQCEAEAFRSITYYPDRPDVLSKFNVTICADSAKYPSLLSNGNKISERKLDNGLTEVSFEDPFPKPSYLFALAAGKFNQLDDEFVTRSGRQVHLTIFLEGRDPETGQWAMDSLKRSMAWDEQVYGREYDLDRFNIVGVDHFVFGAMENKGLNVFNNTVLLATPDIATDMNYRRIETVIAHEYFHNWSGDRVTCRDWFQLCLKEGFTVMRDTHFSADMNGSAVKYTEMAEDLRQTQFPEDRGPSAHAVRPSEYETINNCYTRTIYDKGAQIVRMLSILLGPKMWREATDLYFSRFDGQAVTVEDFLQVAEEVSGRDLSQFGRWYTQAGNPIVRVTEKGEFGERELVVEQRTLPTRDQQEKSPLHIPFAIGVVDSQQKLLRTHAGSNGVAVHPDTDAGFAGPTEDGSLVFDLTQDKHLLKFKNVPDSAQFSVLRGFSAPVTLRYENEDPIARWKDIAINDTDGFNRQEASQSLMLSSIGENSSTSRKALSDVTQKLLERVLHTKDSEIQELITMNLQIPGELQVLNQYPGKDLDDLIVRRDALLEQLADENRELVLSLLKKNQVGEELPYVPDNASMARRGLVQLALHYLRHASECPDEITPQILREHYDNANNLTDRGTYLSALLEQDLSSIEERFGLLEDFYAKWSHDSLLIDRWYQMQARSRTLGTPSKIVELSSREPDEEKSPNRVSSLWGSWSSNVVHYHHRDGKGYELLAETIVNWDARSPQVAARLVSPFVQWHKFDQHRQRLMKVLLENMQQNTKSVDVQDLIRKSLEFEPPKDHF